MDIREARRAVKALMQVIEERSSAGISTVKTIKFNEHGDVVKGEVVIFARREWLGVPGYSWQVRRSGAYGLRTYYTWWLGKAVGQKTEWEAGTLTAYTVDGSAYHGKEFRVIADTHVTIIEGLALS